ncbi:AbgT family transporter [Ferrimonas marina]|uniref:Aminobenzoyl-glutamate transport protein n=1 Tax=Ferrimonas marina TaxID=299255 RepID=A0A1M5RIX8_9GAMM|nr:AbgT family transporter [Ferrimonas marina]SHH26194.1 aminobenzoyl-glutamate transport protein [Ferrimonas marina]
MTDTTTKAPNTAWVSRIERLGHKIPDPIVIFMSFLLLGLGLTALLGNVQFEAMNRDGGTTVYGMKNMLATENVRWLFDNAILANWLAYGQGVLGVILVVMLGVGIAEHSGLLTAVIKGLGARINDRYLLPTVILLGVLSSLATDAGYLVLIPLAGLLYAGMGKNPLIGMAAAFAGVSAGFSANLLPATPVDVFIGMNTQAFAQAQDVPFVNANGAALIPATMHYFFILASTFMLVAIGTWVTNRYVAPRLERQKYQLPEEIDLSEFALSDTERKGLKAAGIALLAGIVGVVLLAMGPLAAYEVDGRTITPYLDNVILLIALLFAVVGAAFGYATGRFKRVTDVANAMTKQMNTMGYVMVLTFFCFNFLAVLNYSGLGTYLTYLGAALLTGMGLEQFPVLLLIGFMLITALLNLVVGSMSAKWMLLGPIFVPMLYAVNPAMTPDLVAAAYRIADSSTNIITPMMTYAGVILAMMRRYRPQMGIGDMMVMMLPYSIAFFIAWSVLLVIFFSFGLPLGF